MKNTWSQFFTLLKNICSDIVFLYKNFIHWNISKLLILLGAFVVWVLLSLPFFILMWVLTLIDPIDWSSLFASDINIYMSIAQYIAIHPFYILAEFILFVIGIALLFLWMSYSIILESNLYLHYFKKEKLAFKSNHYFDASKVYTYFGILGWIVLYLLLPLFVLVVIFLVLFLAFKFLFLPEVILSILLFIAFVICTLWFLYLSYRLSFAYLVYMDTSHKEDIKKSKSYVKRSLALTSGKVFFKFLWVMIIFMILLAPLNILGSNIEGNINEIRNYFWYKSGQIQIVDESDQFQYEYLQWVFSDNSDDELISDLQTLYVQQVIYTFLFFVFFSWVLTMIMVSFYKRALVMQWSKVKKEKKTKGKKEDKKSKKKKVSKKSKKVKTWEKKDKASKKKEIII